MDVCAVIFDRDGTIVVDEPYNGNPELVKPIAHAREAVAQLRAAGIPLAVVSNQSGIGRGLIDAEQVDAVNRRIDDLIGPFDVWLYCPHAPEDGCDCRKPKPKLILDAARMLGVHPSCCVVLGDKESDLEAARAAGATGIKINGVRGLRDAVHEILGARRLGFLSGGRPNS
ncbi:MAG: HAD family hydrolase [Candidatus Eremiobacteraeota bacterium]|nr:HAD family hydrolase [Candidatus Eremiobacteraeota bacterium]